MDVLSLTANFPMGRKDRSRSPLQQDLYDDPRGRDSQYREDDMHHGMAFGDQHSHWDEGHVRRGGASRTSRHQPIDAHDYRGMYDEGHQGHSDYGREQFGDDNHRGDAARYQEGNDPRSHSPSGSQQNRSRSHSPTREAGKPSDTVILEGLPFSVSSSELRESILSNTVAADFPSIDVRISASRGNRRAFVQFQEVDHAVVFMKENFPKLFVELAHSTDDVPDGKFDAYIHYARSREGREDVDLRGAGSGNWTCPTCDFSNYSTRVKCKICGGPQSTLNWQQNLTGVTDAANVPSQILVVYPLAPFVDEDMFTADIKRLELEKVENNKDNSNGAPKLKSTAPTGDTSRFGARPGSLYRTFLMRDTNTDESFKYGFAEFWTLEDATAAMTKFRMSRLFTIAACPATVSTIHMGVFVPEEREVTQAIEHTSFHPLFNPNLRVRYRDPHVYPSQRLVTTHPPGADSNGKQPGDETGEGKKSKKRKADGNLAASSTKKFVPMAGQLAMWQRKRDELRGPGDNAPGNGQGTAPATSDEQDRAPVRISLSGNGVVGEGSKPKTQAPIKISLSSTAKASVPQATPHSDLAPLEPAGATTSSEPGQPSQETATVSTNQ
ncbi:hypothetical protein G7046_g4553 [Stylonectria norvegica]|nr:hypothetical protein G7046_g4553 [Stylonectria norvegica]